MSHLLSGMLLGNRQARKAYSTKVLSIFGSDLIGYWQLDETTGTTAVDKSSAGNNGTYGGAGLALNQPGAISGNAGITLDGSSGYVNIYSIAEEFDPNNLTLAMWLKMNSATEWSDGATHYAAYLQADNDNRVAIYKSATNNQILFYAKYGATTKFVAATVSTTDWFHAAMTVDGSQIVGYINGVALTPTTGVGAWVGTLAATRTVLGNTTTGTPATVWYGGMDEVPIWKKVLTPAEIAALAVAA